MNDEAQPNDLPSRRSMRNADGAANEQPAAPAEPTESTESAANAPFSWNLQAEGQIPSETQPVSAAPSVSAAARTSAKKKRANRQRTKRGVILALVILIPLGLLGGAVAAAWGPISTFLERFETAADYPGTGTEDVVFKIVSGDTGETIAVNLHEQGITASVDAFYDLVLETSPEPVFQPGSFALKKEMSAQSALDALLDPANRLQVEVLIREGETQAQVFEILSAEFGFDVAELESLAADPASFGLPAEARSLEGFLFPATYDFEPGIGARDVLTTLVNRSFQALDEAGVPVEERWPVIVMASLVQKEAGLREDFYKVSRVFYNRLDPQQWPSGLLQSDATVAYGAGIEGRVSTTDAERADASNPYNTYVHPGQVIAPISNPGDLAIDATLNPAEGSWLYFVTWNLETGETIFSTTAAEHDAGVAKWLEWMDENPGYN